MGISDIIEYIKHIRGRWNTCYGLLCVSAIIVAAFFLLPLQFSLTLVARSKLFGLIEVLFVIIWLISRYRRKGKKWIVGIALDADPNAEECLRKAIRGIRSSLSLLLTYYSISFETLDTRVINSRRDAEVMVEQGKAALVIWGNFIDANIDGKPVSKLENVSSTTGLTPIMRKQLNLFQHDLRLVCGTREWIVRQHDSLSDILRLRQNFTEICLFIVAIQMFTTQNLHDCAVVTEFLLYTIADKNNSELKERIKLLMIQSIFLQANIECINHNWKTVRQLGDKLTSMGIAALPIETFLAKACYELGDEESSRKHVELMAQLDANSANTLLDQAFFSIVDKHYDQAVHSYDRLKTRYPNNIKQPVQVIIEFFSDRLRNDRSEIAYWYARGVISLWYGGDERYKLGVNDLHTFLSQSTGLEDYSAMNARAQDILKTESALRLSATRKKAMKRGRKR